jgi:hypothetical protein
VKLGCQKVKYVAVSARKYGSNEFDEISKHAMSTVRRK